jgi:hypothetical protein
VRIENFGKSSQINEKTSDIASAVELPIFPEELISPAYRVIKRHLNPAYQCAIISFPPVRSDLKLMESTLEMRDAPDIA